MPSFLVALLLVAHGLIHVSFASPTPARQPGAPEWPFDIGHSVLLRRLSVGEGATRAIGRVLLVVVVAGYLVAAAAAVGIGPGSLFVPAVAVASAASLAMLALFFHRWLVLGIVIDVALLWLVLVTGWAPGAVAP